MKIDGLLQLLIDQKGSDLFLSVGIEPCLKVNGKMTPLGSVRLDAEMVTDPLLADVGWSWLVDALERHHAAADR